MTEARSPQASPASRARRRRARRMLIPADPEGKEAFLLALARRTYPSLEFFLFSFLCGLLLGIGYLLDSPLILAFGVLSAPILLPWLGMCLAGARGAAGFWVQTAAALLLSALLAFLGGIAVGWLLHVLPPQTLTMAFYHARLHGVDFLMLALGAPILVLSFVRSEEKPYLPSAFLAYALYPPVVAAAIGAGGGEAGLWPHGLLVSLVRLAWVSLLATLIFYSLRFRPPSLTGVLFSGALIVLWLAILAWSGGWPLPFGLLQVATATPAPPAIPSLTPAISTPLPPLSSPTIAPSSTPRLLTPTPSPVLTPPLPTPSETAPPTSITTPTITPIPTPIYGRVSSPRGGGAFLRKEPSFSAPVLISLTNGTVVEVFPQDARLVGSDTWLRVTVILGGRRLEGWMLSTVIQMPTPPAGEWATLSPVSSTPTP